MFKEFIQQTNCVVCHSTAQIKKQEENLHHSLILLFIQPLLLFHHNHKVLAATTSASEWRKWRKLMKRCSSGDIIEEISHYLCCFISTPRAQPSKWKFTRNMTSPLQPESSITYDYEVKIHQNEFIRAAFFSHSWKINILRGNCGAGWLGGRGL